MTRHLTEPVTYTGELGKSVSSLPPTALLQHEPERSLFLKLKVVPVIWTLTTLVQHEQRMLFLNPKGYVSISDVNTPSIFCSMVTKTFKERVTYTGELGKSVLFFF